MISIFIFCCLTVFILNTIVANRNAILDRKIHLNINLLINNLENEIKFNILHDDIKDLFRNGELKLKYYEDINNDLINKNLNQLELGENIIIKILEESKKNIKFNIKICLEHCKLEFDHDFYKSWWMDEINT